MKAMSKQRTFRIDKLFMLLFSYVLLAVMGGVVTSLFFVPGIYAVNNVVGKVAPSLAVEGIDFDVTSLPQRSIMYAADGKTEIATFYSQNRTVVPIKDISQDMIHAVIAREDRRFFEHGGVDIHGVIRAFLSTYVAGAGMQGGSSLTQQYVKNVLLVQARDTGDPIAEYHASEDTIARKVREMLIAVQMEKIYSKTQILQGYLNIAQFGTHNLFGVEAAAHRYFNLHASELNYLQAATIAAITKNPANYDPSIAKNQPEAEVQRNVTLRLMYQQGYITKDQYEKGKATPLVKTLNIQENASLIGCQNAGQAGFFCQYVTRQILNSPEFGKTELERRRLLNEGGLRIYTTMDVTTTAIATKSATDIIPADDPSGLEVALAAIRPGTGEVLGFGLNRIYDATLEAAKDPTRTSINYAVDQQDGGGQGWQIGSSWKPINLIAWMLAGHSLGEPLPTSTRYNQSDFNCEQYNGVGVWHVENAFGGTVNPETPLEALIKSHNTTQASIGTKIKLCAIAKTAEMLGYHNAAVKYRDVFHPQFFTPSMLIGTAQTSPLTMANVYATIAANGVECTPIAIKRVINSHGDDIKVPSANCHQAIPPEIAQTAAYALNQTVTNPAGIARVMQLENGRKTFGKTGTNEDSYLTAGGFLPGQIATFVAVGNAEHPTSLKNISINGRYRKYWFGGDLPVPIWREFMNGFARAAQLPMVNDYGNPSPQYLSPKSVGLKNYFTNGITQQTDDAQEDGETPLPRFIPIE